MAWHQYRLQLDPKPRGFHLVTRQVREAAADLARYRVGLCHIHILHTSASLALNENASPDVAHDLEAHFNEMVPEDQPYYRHTVEGSDDMPAHIKAVLLGNALSVPVADGDLVLGTWQGIFLCEHRDRGGARKLVVTLQGDAE